MARGRRAQRCQLSASCASLSEQECNLTNRSTGRIARLSRGLRSHPRASHDAPVSSDVRLPWSGRSLCSRLNGILTRQRQMSGSTRSHSPKHQRASRIRARSLSTIPTTPNRRTVMSCSGPRPPAGCSWWCMPSAVLTFVSSVPGGPIDAKCRSTLKVSKHA